MFESFIFDDPDLLELSTFSINAISDSLDAESIVLPFSLLEHEINIDSNISDVINNLVFIK